MNSLKNTFGKVHLVDRAALARPNGHRIVSPDFASKWCDEVVAYCPKCENEISAFFVESSEDCGGYWSSFRSPLSATNKSGECTNKSGACA